FLQQGRDIRAAVRIAVARCLATVRQGALVAVAALSAGQSAELCPVLAGQAQRPDWKSSYARKHLAPGRAGRGMARRANCAADLPPQDAQGVLSGDFLVDRRGSSGVLDRSAATRRQVCSALHPVTDGVAGQAAEALAFTRGKRLFWSPESAGEGLHQPGESSMPTKITMKKSRAAGAGQRLAACVRIFGLVLLGWLSVSAHASAVVHLALGGTPESVAYSRLLLEQALALGEHRVFVQELGNLPMTRLELMLQRGDVSALILGPTAERERRFLPVRVDMTDNLVNQRILFIPKGRRALSGSVQGLEDFRRLQLVAGMGSAWADRTIWEMNGLPVTTVDGDWKRLYRMVASQTRPIDYLPRGAPEMASEW